MDNRYSLKIKKRSLPEMLTLWIVALPLLWGLFFDLLKLPAFVKYTADASWVILLAIMIFRRRINIRRSTLPIFLTVCFFLIYTFIIYLFNYQSVFYFLWGLRNNFRYYVFFFALIQFISEEDVNGIFKVLDLLFWVNAAVILIQYFGFGYKQDFLGGIFGVTSGCNAFTVIFFTVIISKSFLAYFENKEKAVACYLKCVVSLIISVLSELKIFFVVFVLVLFVCAFLTKFSWKKIGALLMAMIFVLLGSYLLTALFGFEDFLKLENLWNLATRSSYSTDNTVNRLSAIPTLAKKILTNLNDRIFGLGLGNCDTSAFPICNTPFYEAYGHLRYTYFSCAFLFLEVGYLGIIIYLFFIGMCFVLALKRLKSRSGNRLFCQMAVIMSMLCVILVFYNASLRAEAGYMAYFILALPFVSKENNRC